jgi:hypothetical protein
MNTPDASVPWRARAAIRTDEKGSTDVISTVTSTPERKLNREQVKAIRNADAAVFRWNANDHGAGMLVLTKEVERADGFGSNELRVEIPTTVHVQNYGLDRGAADTARNLLPATGGSWVILSLPYHAEWSTIANQLRVADSLVQEWVVDNRNDLLKQAELTLHELKLTIERPATGGRTKTYTYLLEAGVRDPRGLGDAVERAVRE